MYSDFVIGHPAACKQGSIYS